MKVLIKKAIITEKVTSLSEENNSYTFEVDKTANKLAIKNTIEKMYDVKVESVRYNELFRETKMKYTQKQVLLSKRIKNGKKPL